MWEDTLGEDDSHFTGGDAKATQRDSSQIGVHLGSGGRAMWRGVTPHSPTDHRLRHPQTPTQDPGGLRGGNKYAQDRASCSLRNFVGTKNILTVTVKIRIPHDEQMCVFTHWIVTTTQSGA